MKSLFLALALMAAPVLAAAGELTDAASKAEDALANGDFNAALGALGAAAENVWDQSPLTIRKAVLVASEPLGYGVYDIRDDNRYKAGDPIVIYTEPSGFAYGKDGELFTIDMALDLAIKPASGGDALATKTDFSTWQLRSRVKNREFMGKITYTFDGIDPGDYIVTTTIRDKNSDKTTSFDTPFTITE